MNILVISDDKYFSSGLKEILHEEGVKCNSVNFNNLYLERTNIRIVNYDLTIVDLPLVKNIQRLLPLYDTLKKTLFVLDIQSDFMEDNHFLISKRCSAKKIIKKIRKCIVFKIPQVRPIELEALQLSNAGHNMLSISSRFNLKEKSVYRLRYNLVQKFGFLRYHPLMAIYCEEITSWFIVPEHKKNCFNKI